ncbi:protein spaetzle 5 isoform X1 [Contarinia nasturtii]|uniref:protein spaetzle 5 isoform X1 n=1 Tax=Contarinia nasturtii TaxID=265458 RepID=UPI0012D39A89|nr:protein spaetzle 5 isoform X1 [Contarinia nasturtii]XP_031640222.1 protein spaetzle 5 isoform X1 [Contarinia nasturtii]XP_031640223.1 protein spaetzle 5 isoform X1 [Contarinia nasturtii]XP_031640225.1 protein spaetzle 5 isoform X1 [Contarinia nasturtii]
MNALLWSISFMFLSCETLATSSRFSHQKCGLYGQPPCNFVPSTFGITPVCATPGKTYCEYVPNYPSQAIRLLLDKWGVDNVDNLIVDETIDDFEATRFNDIPPFDQKPPEPNQPPTFTERPNAVSTDGFHQIDRGYDYPNPNKVHTVAPPPASTTGYLPTNGYTVNHNPGADRYWSGFSYLINQRPTHNNNHILSEPYRFQPQPQHPTQNSMSGYYRSNSHMTEYQPAKWFKRYARDVSAHSKTSQYFSKNSTVEATRPSYINTAQRSSSNQLTLSELNDRYTNRRTKRQSTGREQLCQTTYQYVTPQAALNSQGQWMYVVNQVDTTRQLVRTETCASSVCSNICQLPNGYSSRCEQKYVQKRLIALNADGTNLYTDTFWFPSCCACTIVGPT